MVLEGETSGRVTHIGGMVKDVIRVSKLDAARRQLETAIYLYFHDGDPVSIHTLVFAGYDILRDINMKRKGERSLLKDVFVEDYVKTEYQKEMRKKINKERNFFHHGDIDPDGIIDLNPAVSEIFLIEACATYRHLAGEMPRAFIIFHTWMYCAGPNVYILTPEYKMLEGNRSQVVSVGKESYFKIMSRVLVQNK